MPSELTQSASVVQQAAASGVQTPGATLAQSASQGQVDAPSQVSPAAQSAPLQHVPTDGAVSQLPLALAAPTHTVPAAQSASAAQQSDPTGGGLLTRSLQPSSWSSQTWVAVSTTQSFMQMSDGFPTAQSPPWATIADWASSELSSASEVQIAGQSPPTEYR